MTTHVKSRHVNYWEFGVGSLKKPALLRKQAYKQKKECPGTTVNLNVLPQTEEDFKDIQLNQKGPELQLTSAYCTVRRDLSTQSERNKRFAFSTR